MTEFLRGMPLKKQEFTGEVTISWKQGDNSGIQDNRSQTYYVFTYETPNGGKVPVYIQDWEDIPKVIVCNSKLQCGVNDGVFFLVYHDQEQKPNQHRFVLNDTQKDLYQANDWLKSMGVADLSWIAGDYLQDF